MPIHSEDKNVWEKVVTQRKRRAFNWAYSPSTPVDPVGQEQLEEPPAPAPREEPPAKPKASTKNMADRILAEGFSLPESSLEQKPVTNKLRPDPVGQDMGKHQARLLQKRKNSNIGSFNY